MKDTRVWLAVLSCVAMAAVVLAQAGGGTNPVANSDAPVASSTSAATVIPAPSSRPAADFGRYAGLLAGIEMTPKQVKEVAQRAVESEKALADYMDKVKDQWQKAATDSVSDPKAKAVMMDFQQKYDAIALEQEMKVLAALTAQQRLTVETRRLAAQMTAAFTQTVIGHGPGGEMEAHRTPPTAAKMKVIENLCGKAAVKIVELKDPDLMKKRQDVIDTLKTDLAKELGSGTAGKESAPTE